MPAVPSLKPHVELALTSNDDARATIFDPEIARLCEGVRELGSLNASARQANMAYSKAWGLIKNAEEAFGKPLLVRNGAHGSTLSREGEQLLDAYQKLCERVESYTAKQARRTIAKL